MCAIAGLIGVQAEEAVLKKMLETMGRRGPDQEDVWQEEGVTLLHARLAVVDLQGGRQPMELTWKGQRLVLVYNGELYNTPELRRELEALGHTFTGHSDTEVVLHAYAQWQEDCVNRFNGIFAFGVWETGRQRLFLARDRIGVKPLFYTKTADGLLFASELKTLLAHPAVQPKIGLEGIAEVLLIGPGRTPGCGVFQNIFEVEPGCSGYFDQDKLHLHRYWKLRDREHREDFGETAEHVRFLVKDSIERQLVSDVPVCTFLSGGLDSSLISSVAARYMGQRGKRLTTFSVDYAHNDEFFKASKFQPNSDNAYIREMTAYLNSDHHWVVLDTPELTDALEEATKARDLPGMADVDASMLLLCREIKKTATVALSGECADEIFGGYPWYRDPEIRAREGFPWAQSTTWRASFLHPAFRDKIDASAYVDSRYKETCAQSDILPGTTPEERRMKEMVNLNFRWFMQTLLDRKDRMSMYSGLEVRVPFCDWRIAEYLYGVPWAYKDYDGYEKGLLRRAMQEFLPEKVLWRKKSPYPKTHNPAYLEAVSARLRKILENPKAPIFQIVDKSALENLLTAEYAWPWYGQLMNIPQTIAYMLQINTWMEHYQVQIV